MVDGHAVQRMAANYVGARVLGDALFVVVDHGEYNLPGNLHSRCMAIADKS